MYNAMTNLAIYMPILLCTRKIGLRRRDVLVKSRARRYADRVPVYLKATNGNQRATFCNTGLSANPEPTLIAMAAELDRTYRAGGRRLPDNPAVRFDTTNDRTGTGTHAAGQIKQTTSLIALRDEFGRVPRVELPELMSRCTRTNSPNTFTHISERTTCSVTLCGADG